MSARMAPDDRNTGMSQMDQSSSAMGGRDMDANVQGAAPRGGAEYGADDPNFGSARSDYGDLAYGGSLDKTGVRGKSVDDFSSGRVDRGSRGYDTLGHGRMMKGMRMGKGGSNAVWMMLAGAGIGAGLMYMFDPQQGRGRRARMRDQIVDAANNIKGTASSKARDLGNRAQGMMAEASSAAQEMTTSAGISEEGSSSKRNRQGGQTGGSRAR